MNEIITNILAPTGGAAAGLIVSMLLLKGRKFIDIEKRKKTAESMIGKSKEEAEKIKEETSRYVQKRKETLEQEIKKKEQRLEKTRASLKNKEGFLKKREETNNKIRLKLESYKEDTQDLQAAMKRTDKEILDKLSKKTGASLEDLKENTIARYKAELTEENTEKLAKIEEELKESADRKARGIIIGVIQRLCSPTSVETRAVTVKVPKDHIKGKIVGKDGQNIKEFEKLLEVDVVFNDLPNTISISAFQLVKRRVAQKAMEKLVKTKGEINKAVISGAVKDAEKETDEELYGIGKKALEKMRIKSEDKDFTRIVGRLQYRTSYGQNIMMHSMEVAWVAIMLGSELGLNDKTCRIGGFFHDLGKAIDQDPNVKDTHDRLSKEIMEKYGFSKEEVHAAWTHHDSMPAETAEAMVVKAADAISASRPGARQESMDRYIERVKALQETAESFEGVKKAYALSAGREVRVIVDPEKINDKGMGTVAKELAEQIESELTYPGKIKVNVIRRTRHTEIAK